VSSTEILRYVQNDGLGSQDYIYSNIDLELIQPGSLRMLHNRGIDIERQP
jgi:hypothetical protein